MARPTACAVASFAFSHTHRYQIERLIVEIAEIRDELVTSIR
jgi:hypothetical protein